MHILFPPLRTRRSFNFYLPLKIEVNPHSDCSQSNNIRNFNEARVGLLAVLMCAICRLLLRTFIQVYRAENSLVFLVNLKRAIMHPSSKFDKLSAFVENIHSSVSHWKFALGLYQLRLCSFKGTIMRPSRKFDKLSTSWSRLLKKTSSQPMSLSFTFGRFMASLSGTHLCYNHSFGK